MFTTDSKQITKNILTAQTMADSWHIPPQRQRVAAIVKPTYSCNLNCAYCYEGGRSTIFQARMSTSTLKNLLLRLAEHHGPDKEILIIWHGGEPLLMGLDFFKTVIEIQKDFGSEYHFKNSIQTNGTLLTDENIAYFSENNFQLGLSLDGPSWLNDKVRPYKNGNGTFDDIFKNIKLLQSEQKKRHSIFGGVVIVLSKAISGRLNEVYELFDQNGISFKVSPLFHEGKARLARSELGITPKEYGDVLINLFDRWFRDTKTKIDIDPFALIIGNLLTQRPFGCQFSGSCFEKFMAIAPNGDTYPCGRWDNNADQSFVTGNINHQTIEEILTSSRVIAKFRESREFALQKCSSCEYIKICNTGCTDNGYMIRDDLRDKDYYCQGYKALISYIEKQLEDVLSMCLINDPESYKTSSGKYAPIFLPYQGKYIVPDLINHSGIKRVVELRFFKFKNSILGNWTEHTDYAKYGDYSDYSDNYGDHRDYSEGGWKY